ncbi:MULTISPECIES: hypothetical protein [Nocardia]|uniref:hypothetical protein n=1 Tax=Nocardia TaxID=1817 RepID=UPI0012E0D7E0|nr:MULTISPECIES: hypothetical protein [Nocardia]
MNRPSAVAFCLFSLVMAVICFYVQDSPMVKDNVAASILLGVVSGLFATSLGSVWKAFQPRAGANAGTPAARTPASPARPPFREAARVGRGESGKQSALTTHLACFMCGLLSLVTLGVSFSFVTQRYDLGTGLILAAHIFAGVMAFISAIAAIVFFCFSAPEPFGGLLGICAFFAVLAVLIVVHDHRWYQRHCETSPAQQVAVSPYCPTS